MDNQTVSTTKTDSNPNENLPKLNYMDKINNIDLAEKLSWFIIISLIIIISKTGLLASAIAGIALYSLGELFGEHLSNRNLASGSKSRAFGVALTVFISFSLISGFIAYATMLIMGNGLTGLTNLLTSSIDSIKSSLPASLVSYLPENSDELINLSKEWLKEHAGQMGAIGSNTIGVFAHMFLAMAAGGFGAVSGANINKKPMGPLQLSLANRSNNFIKAFENVIFSQAKIALISTVLTALFLIIILPILGFNVPQSVALILLTLVCEMIPVVGNLVSNSAIALACFTVSPSLAIGALVYLALMHKASYFISAKIVGDKIGASNWELLLVMLISEATMGLAGMIIGPVIYSWIKYELKQLDLIN